MKDIKFRAWLKNKKEMVNIALINYVSKYITYVLNKKGNTLAITDEKFNNIEFLQYTGMKDKNGKEIFEGDILEYKHPYDGRIRERQVVKYMKNQSSFGIDDKYGNEIPLYTIAMSNYFKVIGNIYENKELLKK